MYKKKCETYIKSKLLQSAKPLTAFASDVNKSKLYTKNESGKKPWFFKLQLIFQQHLNVFKFN